MCITTGQATVLDTRVYGYVPQATDGPVRHVVGYQNRAISRQPNCMMLNFAGTDLKLVRGPEHTTQMMRDITAYLHGVFPVDSYRYPSPQVTIQSYGDYTVLISQSPDGILDALESEQIPVEQRPTVDGKLEAMAAFMGDFYPHDTFVWACFNGEVKQKHPIVVSYTPHDPELLTVPGLDGHNGELPTIGEPIERNFRLAFGVQGVNLRPVKYRHDVVDPSWAPQSIVGFVDNRPGGKNGNYSLPLDVITSFEGRADEGVELVGHLTDNL